MCAMSVDNAPRPQNYVKILTGTEYKQKKTKMQHANEELLLIVQKQLCIDAISASGISSIVIAYL